jgi:DNA-binding NarL/FixJ family response regulator
MAITVSIVEDNRGTREALAARVNQAPSLHCLNTYSNGELALRGIPSEPPDVVLVDINLPGMSGIECVANLKERLPQLPMLMITTYEEGELIFNSLRAGAKGYLLKNTPPAELVQAIEQLHAGGAPMSMQIARKVVDHFYQQRPASEIERLSRREEEVLALLAKGLIYKEISETLDISLATVRTHVHHIYEKLHVQSRTEATIKFLARD